MEELLRDVLLNLAIAVVTLLSSYGVYYVRKAAQKLTAEAEKIEDEGHRQLVNDAISRLEDVATKTVGALEQTTAKELRQAVKDGVRSREELVSLSGKAFEEICNTVGPEYLSFLALALGDVDAYIKSTIEAKVLQLKEGAV